MAISFDEVWAEHKSFLVPVGLGLVALVVGLSTAAGFRGAADRAERLCRRIERDVEARAQELEGREGYELGLAAALEERVGPQLRGTLETRPRTGFVLPAGASPFIFYGDALAKVGAARAGLEARGVKLPRDLGLTEKPSDDRLKERLAVLDVADRMLGLLGELEIPEVRVLQMGEPEYVPLLPAEDKVPEGTEGAGERGETGLGATTLRRLPLKLSVVAPLDRAHQLLASLLKPQAVLEIGKAKLEREPDREGDVRVELELAALALLAPDEVPTTATSRSPGSRPAGTRISRRGAR